MAQQCFKTFSLAVTGETVTPLGYWKLEEAGDVDRIDSINSVPLRSVSTPMQNGAGKIALGAVFVPGASTLSEIITDQFALGAVDLTSGMHFTIWVKWNSFDTNTQVIIPGISSVNDETNDQRGYFEVYWSAAASELNIILHRRHPNGTHTFTVPFTPTPGQWYFFSAYYDVANNTIGVGIDGDPPDEDVVGFDIDGNSVSADTYLGVNGLGGAATVANITMDEFAFWGRKLTDTQVDYIRNGGAGRTWPMTLPA